MKTRTGFVSNSSSSSFVIITTEKLWKDACEKFKETVGENIASIVIDGYGSPDKAKILGQDALVFNGVISSEEYGYDACQALEDKGILTEDESSELAMEAYNKMGDFETLLTSDGISYVAGDCC